MTDQLYIDQDGSISAEPLTWDGEPLYSRSSVQEGLFETDAFSQFRGQQALETDAPRYYVIDRMGGKDLAGPFARWQDAFNARATLGPIGSVVER